MSSTLIIVFVPVVIVALALAARGGGPRVTTIERRSEKKDRDDA